MVGAGGLSAGGLVLAVILLLAWIVVLAWMSGLLLRAAAKSTGWQAGNWRTILLCFVIILAAIHFGNWAIGWFEAAFAGERVSWPGFPPAFLIGSVAIGIGIAAVRSRNR